MTKINRRRFLAAATTACAGIVPSPARTEEIAWPYNFPRLDEEKGGSRPDYWFIKREFDPRPNAASNVTGHPIIDFWSREYSDVPYADYLPPEIPKGVLWYDPFGSTNVETFKYIDSIYKKSQPKVEHQFAAHRDGVGTLSSTLRQMIRDEPSRSEHARTALIALDSLGPSSKDPEWTDIIPAIGQCYDHVIALIHTPRRGLRDWMTFLNTTCGKEFFEQSVWNSASQCDVVIVTSAGLVETDPGLCTRATTEMLVGELIRRLGYALLNRDVLDQVLAVHQSGQRRKPRLFALSSQTLNAIGSTSYEGPYSEYNPYLDHHAQVFYQQYNFVLGGFGHKVDDERSLRIATRIDDPWPAYFAEIEQEANKLARETAKIKHNPPKPSYRPPGWKQLFEAPGPAYQSDIPIRLGGALDLITLWPFNFDGLAEQSGK